MTKDKYTAVWVSHSSLGDFLKCPRAYYLHNVYKDPKTGHKLNVVSPALSLGSAVHEVVEGLLQYPAEARAKQPLFSHYELAWQKVSGHRGGFKSTEEERASKERGRKMIERVMAHPGPLLNKAVKLPEHENNMPPNYFLSEEDNIILCGKIDWLEYLPENDSLHIIDFKTGRHEENDDSLQLPIYLLLLSNLQKRKVNRASYWYLETDNEPKSKWLPTIDEAYERVIEVARRVKEARELGEFACPHGGCMACQPFEKILAGEAEFVGVGGYGQDLYLA
ncbi:MAG: hypothetical protein A2589_00830 [Candidatus Vogelbacteria bacterium RIFOXYD1_FULL_46_19]|uniref:PD-(D/E)XK endonuclease-like domain-containing protein n=1 Tax=Candidatus Vogelbacteria bacterium RIFOXYD1_FULL_46_19 TaxID=1802439 RepID=A0A1G2QH36_9BACT|nr:MAG: hypothetical protein A2589_00830 [Candidatus Vogelbacteria bacterium RIFOXYD1_FULL_46_19]